MSNTIFKYPVSEHVDSQTIELPEGAVILSLQTQRGYPVIWANVDPDNKPILRTLKTFGTGHVLPDLSDFTYLGTYQEGGGYLVWHVYIENVK